MSSRHFRVFTLFFKEIINCGLLPLLKNHFPLLGLKVSRPGNLDHPPEFLDYLPVNF